MFWKVLKWLFYGAFLYTGISGTIEGKDGSAAGLFMGLFMFFLLKFLWKKASHGHGIVGVYLDTRMPAIHRELDKLDKEIASIDPEAPKVNREGLWDNPNN